MTLNEIDVRLEELRNIPAEEIETKSADEMAAINSEMTDLIEERKKIMANAETRKAQLEEAAKFGTEDKSAEVAPKEARTMDLKEIRSSHEYNMAYAEYLKTGDATECRALLTELASPAGEVPVAVYLEEGIQTAWKQCLIASRARHISVKGVIEIPFEYSATPAVVHAEGAAAPAEEVLEIGQVTIKPETLKKWITVSDTVLALKGEAFLDYIVAEIAQRITELEDKEAVNAIKAAIGATTKTQPGVKAIAETAITFETIFKALAVLADGATNPVAIMNKQTYFADFMTLKDSALRPIYNVVVENGRPTYYINGVPVLFSDELTAHTEIIVGDMSGLTENIPDGGINFIRDPYSLAEKNLIKLVGRKMVGFGVTKEDYFAVITVGA